MGFFFRDVLARYTNFTGGNLILLFLMAVGFIMATGYSLVSFLLGMWRFVLTACKAMVTGIQNMLQQMVEKGPGALKTLFSIFPNLYLNINARLAARLKPCPRSKNPPRPRQPKSKRRPLLPNPWMRIPRSRLSPQKNGPRARSSPPGRRCLNSCGVTHRFHYRL